MTFLAVMPAPYMMDLFEAIHRDPRFRLSVHFLEKPAVAAPGVYWQERDLPPYASVLPGGWFSFSRARIHVNTGLFAALEKDRPDVVIVLGYVGLTCQLAMYGLSLKRIPWIFWGEIPGFERRGIVGRLLRWLALRPVACLADGIAAIGMRAAAAYRVITKPGLPISNIPYYCDTDALVRIDRSNVLRPEVAHFLYCGQLVPRKGVDLLVRAYTRLAQEHREIRLTLVGDGPLRERLASSIPDSVRERVTWAGFKETKDLPAYFGHANVFVLPSLHDGWGVVINQAVSAGMAVIASDAVGAAVDLVTNGVNGLIFPNQDENALLGAMRYFVAKPDAIRRFGEMSRSFAQAIRPEAGANRWYELCRTVVDGRGRNGSRGATP